MTPLERLVRNRLERGGELPVTALVSLALHHPEHGYYATRDPLGAAGDFTTAPEISQVFGELIGAWIAVMWEQMGCPRPILLAEAGPGRGTLMADACRAIGGDGDLLDHAEIHLVDSSPSLRATQAATLSGLSPVWHNSLEALPPGPIILFGNEFLDCHPPVQLVRRPDGWAERLVTLQRGRLAIVPGTPSDDLAGLVPPELRNRPPGTVFESHRTLQRIACALAKRIVRHGGTILFVDYGHDRPAAGDTLQAVRAHRRTDPLGDLGECDITAHVDFSAVAAGLRAGGALVHGPVTQRQFLRALGIDIRTGRLAAAARSRQQRDDIEGATRRLIDPAGMGTLFKVVAATATDMPEPPGFAPAAAGPC